ncbi:DNA topoisomerase III [Nitrincola sp. A-D6]|uniref:DNA topoisomerase III n=1 Tax=Nitrincola sp. A-D6 TaxID=1545442 RepID=UPI00051FC32D|nr:DNA topoisomerase III [Nitrincola sp. A-D6]KGK42750.1 DNA topoisomerase III [Nitrincola sp. A-D6]
MRLYIAEKPSLGRAIADALPGSKQRGDGFVRCGQDVLVSWCIGHLLEQAEPEAYDPAFKSWRMEHLPILPGEWQLQPKSATRKQLTVLRKLVKQADELVHAGDPDREGQLLVDEVIAYLKVPEYKRNTVQRCLISDLNPDAVRRALAQLKPNREFVPLSTSALARSRADWLYGINLTRACTLQGQQSGYQGVLSVGRVQTPVLGLVVRRDETIEAFVSKPFYEVLAQLETEAGEHFQAKWQPSEACAAYQDEEGRVISKALAENVIRRITGQPAQITQLNRKTKQQPAPLPYSLSALQIDAGKRYGMSAQQVLDTCQSLYEKHTLITYPRSDSRYLPEEHLGRAERVVKAIRSTCPALAEAADGTDLRLRSKAWNDKKVDAHHAIIPTEKQASGTRLSANEQRLYELIARQYLIQFYPPWCYHDTEVLVDIAGGCFIARARETQDSGWKVLFPSRQSDDDGDEPRQSALPPLKKGQSLRCLRGELQEKMTQPPKHFTDATLLAAMTGIARYVKDPEIRKILRETDGLGTEATRAGIIELLFKRQFLMRQGKQILATPAGKGLINSLPEPTTLPDMTAEWEARLDAISQREDSYQAFMHSLETTLSSLISQVSQSAIRVPAGTGQRPKRKATRRRKARSSKL